MTERVPIRVGTRESCEGGCRHFGTTIELKGFQGCTGFGKGEKAQIGDRGTIRKIEMNEERTAGKKDYKSLVCHLGTIG
jgi:hypothetical protein